jgi:Ca2+/Na+ antiporter
MEILTIICLVMGSHIIMARIYTGVNSNFRYYWFLGFLEGIPLIISGLLLQFLTPWSFILFIISIGLYFYGSFLKNKLDKEAKRNSPEKWSKWDQKKKNTTKLVRISFFIF